MTLPPDPAPTAMPRWLHQPAGAEGLEAALFHAGAGLAALDPLARDPGAPGMLWRRRLALAAAVAVARLEGRREGEAALRDLAALARPGEDPGPAGRMLKGWRGLCEARALRSSEWPARLPGFFDLPAAPLEAPLREIGARFAGKTLPPRFAAMAAHELLALGPQHRGLALWIADALLARALGWEQPVPLLAAHLPRAAFRLEGEPWLAACASAWGRAALEARVFHAGLARKARALEAAAPKLRGRDAKAAVALLLSEDALPAHAGARASDRAARRLFERLTALGLVRELTGRASFRLYGL